MKIGDNANERSPRMNPDVFGNLIDWYQVLEKLDSLRESGQLDAHQEGLTRILRYRDNWRLRETVLEYIKDLEKPRDELLLKVLDIVMDDGIYYDVRILAAQSLTSVISKRKNENNNDDLISKKLIIQKMNMLLKSPQPPSFQNEITKLLEGIK